MLAKILEPSTESSSFEFAQRGAEVSQFLKMQTGNTGIHFPLLSGIFLYELQSSPSLQIASFQKQRYK